MINISNKIKNLPVGALATAVGAATLSNVYNTFGFSLLRDLFMYLGIIIFILGLFKLTIYRKVFINEYKNNVVLASLYGTFSMLAMILGSYILPLNKNFGILLWSFGVLFHAALIFIFTFKYIFKDFKTDNLVPSWFVTYNGIMVSIVIGGGIHAPLIKKIILYYGISIFIIIIPFMINRLVIKPLPEKLIHTKAILLAPSSLCVVSYLSVEKNPNFFIISLLYAIVLITLIYILLQIPKFFSYTFHPGFAGLTFPMAIGTVASLKMSAYIYSLGYIKSALFIKNITGLQIFVTTGIIAYVYFNFLKLIKSL